MVCKKARSTFLLREILLLFFQRCHDSVHKLRKTWAHQVLDLVLVHRVEGSAASWSVIRPSLWRHGIGCVTPGSRATSFMRSGFRLGAMIAQRRTT